MNIEEARLLIEKSKMENTHCLFKGIFKDVPSWDKIFDHMNYEYFRDLKLNFSTAWKTYNGVAINSSSPFYIQIRDASFHPEYSVVSNFFDEALNEKTSIGGVFLDLVGQEEKVFSHADPMQNLHWQVHGTTTWEFRTNIDNLDDDPQDIIKLESGDVVFIPDGLYHSVYSDTPRCGMTIPYSVRRGIVSHG
jgi:hypothetical protein